MYRIINLLNATAFRHRVKAVYEVLLAVPEPLTKQEIHDDFLSAWVGWGGTRVEAQAAWRRLVTLENPTAAELALYARVLGVNTTWLLTGDVRFIKAELFADHCLCQETPHSQHFVFYGATEPGGTLEHNPDCLVHADPVQPSPLAHQGTATLAQPRTRIQDWSSIAGATFAHRHPSPELSLSHDR